MHKAGKRHCEGFTLMELLIVIIILGFMVGMLMPFGDRLDNDARRRQTRAAFEEIRAAIVGPRGACDAAGNPVVGGYAGDVGHLPYLHVYAWEDGRWMHPDADGDGRPDTTANNAGGVAGDDQAQPAGLWTKTLFPVKDGSDFKTVAIEDDELWRGPYLAQPADRFPDDQARQFVSGASSADDKENNRGFCLRETEGRLSDGWGRALIVYVEDGDADGSADLDEGGRPLNLVFVSAGPDGCYDVTDPADKTLAHNGDNLVLRIGKAEWDDSEHRRRQSAATIRRIRAAIAGASPGGVNDGFTGDLARLPYLYRWEGSVWDETESGGASYTVGQPREIWAGKDAADTTDYNPGFGWDRPYLEAPLGYGEDEILKDAWDKEILFFHDAADDSLLAVSRGADGEIDLTGMQGSVSALEDLDAAAAIDNSGYNRDAAVNRDNITSLIRKSDWEKGYFSIDQITVAGAVSGQTKIIFYYGAGARQIVTCDAGGTWTISGPAISRSDVVTGSRELTIWQDVNSDDAVADGEVQETFTYNVITTNALEPRADLSVDLN